MASPISALNHYRPQIEYGETAGWREVAEFLEARTTLSKTDIIATLTGLQDAVLHFNLQGRGVKLEGLGTYLPNINYQGEIDAAHRLDRRLKRQLNNGSFSGKIRNKKNIGKTVEQVVAMWNAEHPDDPVLY
ncbi:MAG: hypothetical protein J0L96_13875 [Anaerolineae bacterium]|nr:hypothetical protein [Anaerolineae bacterium]